MQNLSNFTPNQFNRGAYQNGSVSESSINQSKTKQKKTRKFHEAECTWNDECMEQERKFKRLRLNEYVNNDVNQHDFMSNTKQEYNTQVQQWTVQRDGSGHNHSESMLPNFNENENSTYPHTPTNSTIEQLTADNQSMSDYNSINSYLRYLWEHKERAKMQLKQQQEIQQMQNQEQERLRAEAERLQVEANYQQINQMLKRIQFDK